MNKTYDWESDYTLTPTTNRGREWARFAVAVLEHIETYTVPQYGDGPLDELEEWSAEDCVRAAQKYSRRFGRNQRDGQETLDCQKAAHYFCAAYFKLLGIPCDAGEPDWRRLAEK